jgi:hypothetical protein
MAEKATIEGKIDDKPLPPAIASKVEGALKNALASELKTAGIIPTHHFSVTHYSVVYTQA